MSKLRSISKAYQGKSRRLLVKEKKREQKRNYNGGDIIKENLACKEQTYSAP